MHREQFTQLKKWKASDNRKPLLIRGARQVGKTWLMKAFGEQEYRNYLYINFESNKRLKEVFSADFDVSRIFMALQIETGIAVTEDTLLIFDEIQEAPGALTSLKYFYENAPQYHIIAAGSLLGVALHNHTSFPVGKIAFLDLYPLSFKEFLMALGQQPLLDLLIKKDWILIKVFKDKYIQLLRQYYFIGGMPEAVLAFSERADFTEVREILKRILNAYEQDFSKHAPYEIVPRIRLLWNAIPAQLAKENRKFIYSKIKKGARAKDYELAMGWLIDCGLIHKVNRAAKPAMPLKAYEDFSAFKLFLVDVGLMSSMVDIDPKTLLEGSSVFVEFKGALTEQYVLQELLTQKEIITYYWAAENRKSEIDFLLQVTNQIIPVEVKATENLKAKSLKIFNEKYAPPLAIRTSLSDFRDEEWLTNVPLYAIGHLKDILEARS